MGPNGTATCAGCKTLSILPYRGLCYTCLDKAIALLKKEQEE